MNIWVAQSVIVSCLSRKMEKDAGKLQVLYAIIPVSSIFRKNPGLPSSSFVNILPVCIFYT